MPGDNSMDLYINDIGIVVITDPDNNDELLGFILLTIPAVIFSQFFYAQKDEGIAAGGEDDDSGLSL